MNTKFKSFIFFVNLSLLFPVTLFAENLERGKSLHNENCTTCHKKMYPGDGSGIYTRADKRIETLDGLQIQVNRCKDSLGFKWPEDQIDDVVAYLNKQYYKFEE